MTSAVCNWILYKGSQKEQQLPLGLYHCSSWYLFWVMGTRHVHLLLISACCHFIVYLNYRAVHSLNLVHLWSLSKPSGLFPVDQHWAVLQVAGPKFPEADVCRSSILTQTVQLAFGEHDNSKYNNTENEDRNRCLALENGVFLTMVF